MTPEHPPGNPATDRVERETLRGLLARAVADIGAEDDATIFADADSRTAVADAYDQVVSGDVADADDARQVVDAVAEQLAGASVTLTHRSNPGFDAASAATYSFLQTGDADHLADAGFDDPVLERLLIGATDWDAGDFLVAADSFDDAAGVADDTDAVVSSHVLAGAALHRAGADADAIDHVRSALEADREAWTPLVVGIAAGSDLPRRFRDGGYSAMLYARWTANTPADCSVEAEWRPSPDADWQALGDSGCAPLSTVTPETEFRYTLSGTVPEFPDLLGYYVAVGAIAEGTPPEALSSDRMCFSGPVADDVSETLAIER
ncbi:hypothetical protein [Haloarchaeobius amylolyticus]|uniref:hypothetical protein n=1 Tax=Haloarchaeobius amylolyticus TaxID=1198296 RepID=UPI00226D9E1E|nr:hypothetical protein [Haloarchaeobius amylolyticus]